MQRLIWIAALLGAVPALEAAPAEVEWRTDLEGARAEARRDNRPMLIVFR